MVPVNWRVQSLQGRNPNAPFNSLPSFPYFDRLDRKPPYVRRPLHPFHILEPSPWPFMASLALLLLANSLVLYLGGAFGSKFLLTLSLILLVSIAARWFADIFEESSLGYHSETVVRGFKIGFMLFIVSEAMLFFAFFWAFFDCSLSASVFNGGVWPPPGIEAPDPFGLPLFNTLLLLTSGALLTLGHLLLLESGGKTFFPTVFEHYAPTHFRPWFLFLLTGKRELLEEAERNGFPVTYRPGKTFRGLSDMEFAYLSLFFRLYAEVSYKIFRGQLPRFYTVDDFLFLASFSVFLGFSFLNLQLTEYRENAFAINDGMYGSVFYLLTGLHGLHVLAGALALSVFALRCLSSFNNPLIRTYVGIYHSLPKDRLPIVNSPVLYGREPGFSVLESLEVLDSFNKKSSNVDFARSISDPFLGHLNNRLQRSELGAFYSYLQPEDVRKIRFISERISRLLNKRQSVDYTSADIQMRMGLVPWYPNQDPHKIAFLRELIKNLIPPALVDGFRFPKQSAVAPLLFSHEPFFDTKTARGVEFSQLGFSYVLSLSPIADLLFDPIEYANTSPVPDPHFNHFPFPLDSNPLRMYTSDGERHDDISVLVLSYLDYFRGQQSNGFRNVTHGTLDLNLLGSFQTLFREKSVGIERQLTVLIFSFFERLILDRSFVKVLAMVERDRYFYPLDIDDQLYLVPESFWLWESVRLFSLASRVFPLSTSSSQTPSSRGLLYGHFESLSLFGYLSAFLEMNREITRLGIFPSTDEADLPFKILTRSFFLRRAVLRITTLSADSPVPSKTLFFSNHLLGDLMHPGEFQLTTRHHPELGIEFFNFGRTGPTRVSLPPESKLLISISKRSNLSAWKELTSFLDLPCSPPGQFDGRFSLYVGNSDDNSRFHWKNHPGFECSVWYWHFVDFVWLLLYVFVYLA